MENEVRREGRYEYTVKFGEATIVRHVVEKYGQEIFDELRDLTVPAYLGGYPVVEIGNSAFMEQFMITGKVTASEGVRVIGARAFIDCHGINEFKLPSTLERIEGGAFALCMGIGWMVVPRGVNYIGEQAFWLCNHMERAWIPDTVVEIPKEAFSNCGSLHELYVPRSTNISTERVFFECWGLDNIIRYDYMQEPQGGNFRRAESVGIGLENAERYKR